MPDVWVSVVTTRSGEVTLGDDMVTIGSEPIVLSVTGHSSRRIRVDGIDRRLSAGVTGVHAIDYTRSTGFHRIEVDRETFWFATEDHKLRLDGITRMLGDLQSVGTGWTGQALFSDGSGYMDPHVLYGWFDANADQALDAIETVLLSPRTAQISVRTLSRRGGSSVLAVPTMRFLRSDPNRNLVEQPGGLLTAGNASFNPTRVVARRRQHTVDTVPNRRAVHLLGLIHQLLSELVRSQLPKPTLTRCRIWRERVARLSTQPLAVKLRSSPTALAAPRQGVEFTDRNYGRIFDLTRQVNAFGWTGTKDRARRYSYIQNADRIYQAYAAHRVAAVLGLAPTTATFGSEALAFSGEDFDLYYDCEPPAEVAASWRSGTTVPDASKPDLLLHERATGRVAILDAKYRIGKDGHASEDSRKEVAAYQSLYGLASVAILYPGTEHSARVVEGYSMSLAEIPIVGIEDDLHTAIGLVLGRLQWPPYT
jgi:hypothetical protein